MSSFEWLLSADGTALLTPSPVLPDFRCNHSSLHTGSETRTENLSENKLKSGWYLQKKKTKKQKTTTII